MRVGRAIAGAAILMLLTVAPVAALDSFLDSQSYKGGERVVGVLLTDEEYGRLNHDVEHLEGRLD